MGTSTREITTGVLLMDTGQVAMVLKLGRVRKDVTHPVDCHSRWHEARTDDQIEARIASASFFWGSFVSGTTGNVAGQASAKLIHDLLDGETRSDRENRVKTSERQRVAKRHVPSPQLSLTPDIAGFSRRRSVNAEQEAREEREETEDTGLRSRNLCSKSWQLPSPSQGSIGRRDVLLFRVGSCPERNLLDPAPSSDFKFTSSSLNLCKSTCNSRWLTPVSAGQAELC